MPAEGDRPESPSFATIRGVTKNTFPTSQDAEAAFYDAFERGDLDAMMEVWAEDEEILCVHPGGQRLTGYEQVREGWAQIFKARQKIQIQLSDQSYVQGMMLAVHSVLENIVVVGENQGGIMVCTNVYSRTASGWRLLIHHASPAPPLPAARAGDAPKILH